MFLKVLITVSEEMYGPNKSYEGKNGRGGGGHKTS